jgi:hypothetical protein
MNDLPRVSLAGDFEALVLRPGIRHLSKRFSALNPIVSEGMSTD